MSEGYYVYTWDHEIEEWTPQIGVPEGPYTLGELRGALRELQGMGYDTARDFAPCVLVTRGPQ